MNLEQAILYICDHLNTQGYHQTSKPSFSNGTTGTDIALILSFPIEELIDTFNKGTAGYISHITTDSGIEYISWAPTYTELLLREFYR